jgi:hypothetical protein
MHYVMKYDMVLQILAGFITKAVSLTDFNLGGGKGMLWLTVINIRRRMQGLSLTCFNKA